MAFKIPPLPNAQLIDERGYPNSIFSQYWQQLTTALTTVLQQLATVLNVTLPSFQTALDSANAATAAATAAAAAANAAAAASAAMATANAKEQALVNSYITPDSVLTATPTLITVAAHTRRYANGTSVAVNGGTLSATGPGDTDFISYNDPTRAGGTVTYAAFTTQPAQSGDTHVVGAVAVPTTGTANGGVGPRKPGFVQP